MPKLITEMKEEQRVALELYLKLDDEHKPPSFVKLSADMLACGFNASSSTLQRWSKECDFEHYLQQHINALILADEERAKELDSAAGEENFKRTLLSLADNNELTNASYKGLKMFLKQILDGADKGKAISKEDAKLLIQIYTVSSARDDKLLDRKSFLEAAEKLTKDDLLRELRHTAIPMESLPQKSKDAIDVEIEDD